MRRWAGRGAWVLAIATVIWAAAIVCLSGDVVRPERPRISDSARAVIGITLVDGSGGPEIKRVVPPGRTAGLRAGDRIVAVDGRPVQRAVEVAETIGAVPAGTMVRVEARRGQPGSQGGVLVDVRPEIRQLSPADLDLPFRGVEFQDPWKLVLRGWYIPAPPGSAPAPGIAYGHGNGTDRRQWLDMAADVHDAGFAQVLFDFAGRGESDGEVITLGEREAGDLGAALDLLAREPGVDPSRLFLAGRSMGAAAAVLCAAGRPSLRGLVLDGAYTDLARLIDDMVAARGLPPLLVRPALLAVAGWRAEYDPSSVRPIDAIRRVRCPVLIVHGDKDELVPFQHARDLAEAAGSRATLVPLPGLGHNGARPSRTWSRIIEFLKENS